MASRLNIAKELVGLINQVHGSLKLHLQPELSDAKLTYFELMTLGALTNTKKTWTITHLADEVGITQPGMSSMIRILERRKLAKIVTSNDDKRRRHVTITDSGASIYKKLQAWRETESGAHYVGLDKKELEKVLDTLALLNDNIIRSTRRMRRF